MDEVVVLSIPQIIVTFVAAMGVPSALTSYMLSRHEKRLEKRDEQRERESKERKGHGQAPAVTPGDNQCISRPRRSHRKGCPAYSGCEMQR